MRVTKFERTRRQFVARASEVRGRDVRQSQPSCGEATAADEVGVVAGTASKIGRFVLTVGGLGTARFGKHDRDGAFSVEQVKQRRGSDGAVEAPMDTGVVQTDDLAIGKANEW